MNVICEHRSAGGFSSTGRRAVPRISLLEAKAPFKFTLWVRKMPQNSKLRAGNHQSATGALTTNFVANELSGEGEGNPHPPNHPPTRVLPLPNHKPRETRIQHECMYVYFRVIPKSGDMKSPLAATNRRKILRQYRQTQSQAQTDTHPT